MKKNWREGLTPYQVKAVEGIRELLAPDKRDAVTKILVENLLRRDPHSGGADKKTPLNLLRAQKWGI